jgi:hypothetical protein
MAALEARHMADLTFQEVSRSLRALSSTYVERRERLKEGAALAGAGKRAAFALFYGPLHLLMVRHVAASLGARFTSVRTVLDLGCGTGASGAGWALACAQAPRLTGVDRHPWAVTEARRSWADLALPGTARVDDFTRVPLGASRSSAAQGSGVLLAYAVNEVAGADVRGALLDRLLAHAAAGARVIVLEPIAKSAAPWWGTWQEAFVARGGRADEWRVAVPLPPLVMRLDRAAGLDHRELKARSLAI